ncbi:MAG TPA: conjugal transfer protein [Mycobacteriales bacterium]|nr:conjugal transfer protein [Mycobacteriales bacterium]
MVLWTAAAVVLAAGLRQIVYPPSHPNSARNRAAGPAWPAGAAGQVATRFAVDYLTFDEDEPGARSQALSADRPAGVDTTAGWDGHGRQTVVVAVPGDLNRRGRIGAVATVQAQVVPYTRTGSSWRALPPVWRTLAVPVGLVSGRVVVTGAPAYLGPTPPPTPPTLTTPTPDAVVSARTRTQAEAFFTAYAAGDTTAYTTPGTHLVGLGGQVSFAGLDSWSVHTGPPGAREATAVVRWQEVTGAVLTQPYRLRLVRIATNGGSRWFVDRIGADTGNGGR